MIIKPMLYYEEIVSCIDMSLHNYSDDLFIPNRQLAIKGLMRHIEEGGYAILIFDDKKLVSYGIASIAQPQMHSNDKALIQKYYHTTVTGREAVKALRLFHEDMVRWARDHGVPVCISNSILPNYEVFNRILSRDGWVNRGATMYKLTGAPHLRTR